ncbi:c-type cytochrome [Silvanigrella sp.]|jgi:mono/diheme cytochrome c family protein|uniref:c-type cytochrome n=1 Tax=Silvanigrella sp. TaxID=2024976 RepID=UPI0037CA999C
MILSKILIKYLYIFIFLFFTNHILANTREPILLDESFFTEHNKKLKRDQFEATSLLYKKKKTYDGYYLKDIFKFKNIDILKLDVVTFDAKDGFKISIPASFINENDPLLSIRDASLAIGKNWEEVQDGGRIIDGGPYYLMWDLKKYKVPENYWAFGVVKILFQSFKETYGESIPENTSNKKIMQGFQIYQSSCSGCHSVNLVGGTLGLEMNVPKNFTEYLSKRFIISYSKSPSSYRANAKMPPQHFLSVNEINLVIAYLEAMKYNKVCNTDDSCQKLVSKK